MSPSLERRGAARIDKVFRILVSSEELGDQWCVARNISQGGMFVEMADPMPLRTKVIVRFSLPHDPAAICAIARVQNHYYLQYADDQGPRSLVGVGLRFIRFVAEAGESWEHARLH